MKCECVCGCQNPFEPAYTGGEPICWRCKGGAHIDVKLEDVTWEPDTPFYKGRSGGY